jgi:hypothetical protein
MLFALLSILATLTAPDLLGQSDNSAAPAKTIFVLKGAQPVGALLEKLNQAGSNSTIELTNYSETTASPVVISGDNVTLSCGSGSVITKSGAYFGLAITGSNVTVQGCDIEGAGFGSNGIEVTGNNVQLLGNTVHGHGLFGIHLNTVQNYTVRGGSVTGNLNIAIFAEAATASQIGPGVVAGVAVDASSAITADAHAFTIHTSAAGSTAVGNRFIDSNAKISTGFCAESWQGRGSQPSGTVFSNLICNQTAKADGGVSFSGSVNGSVTNLLYSDGGFGNKAAGIEFTQGGGHNSANGGSVKVTGPGIGIVFGESNDCASVPVTDTGGTAIYVGTSAASTGVQHNTVGPMPVASGGANFAVWEQANNATANVSSNTFTGLKLTGDGAKGGTGLMLELDSGMMANNELVGLQFTNFDICINHGYDTETVAAMNQFTRCGHPDTGNPGSNYQRLDRLSGKKATSGGQIRLPSPASHGCATRTYVKSQ